MKKFELTSGETLKLTLTGNDFSDSTIYLTLMNDEGIKLKKKFYVSSEVAEIVVNSDDTWGLTGSFYGELIIILNTGEVLIENFAIEYKERILDELW